MIKVMKREDLVSHDVLEFCYSIRYPRQWNFDSVFVYFDEFMGLNFYLKQVIPNYKYFDAQRVSLEEWKQIEELAMIDKKYQEFFCEIDVWKQRDPEKDESFWIYGV